MNECVFKGRKYDIFKSNIHCNAAMLINIILRLDRDVASQYYIFSVGKWYASLYCDVKFINNGAVLF